VLLLSQMAGGAAQHHSNPGLQKYSQSRCVRQLGMLIVPG